MPLTTAACVSRAAYRSEYLQALPTDIDAACATSPIVGHDAATGTFWARVDQEGRFAVVARP